MRLRLRSHHLGIIEAALIGVFFIQALRFLIGMLYSRVAGASVVLVTDPAALDTTIPGAIDPAVVTAEISFLVYMLFLPLLALLIGRFRISLVIAAALVAIGRAAMIVGPDPNVTYAASLTVGAGLLYIAVLVRQRARMLPYLFILGLSIDQLLRAIGNTLDPSWSASTVVLDFPVNADSRILLTYLHVQLALSALAIIASLFAFVLQRREAQTQEASISLDRGLLPLWGAIGMGALLFLELSLLALPNAIAGRTNVDYTTFVPFVMAATALPLIPWIRAKARGIIGLFDSGVRGWSWMLMVAMLVVFGTRFRGIGGGAALVMAQFTISMLWWWVVRPQAEKERNFTGLWMIVAVFIFGLLAVGDFFTYEYAYVRDLTGNLQFLNDAIPPLLRGFRGMGLGVILLAVFFAVIPMTQTLRRIPWAESKSTLAQSFVALLLVGGLSIGSALAARPPLVQALTGVDSFRVGTYNIHSGFNEFFHFDMGDIASTVQQSGGNVVLLQEVEAGRMTSFGVDEALWMARRLHMDKRFYPTNEGLQGLAVLSNIPIVFHQGSALSSVGNQTGVQQVQVSTDGVSAIAFYNTWLGLLLDIPGERPLQDQEQDQQRQLTEIFAIIARDYENLAGERIVVGGTFNNIPGSPLIDQMRATGFNDPFAGRPPELSNTIWRTNLRARLDFIWTRNVVPLGALVMDSSASDHRMAVVEILVNRRAS
jgi:endonuclease/exonuclease/phosphatase family metal-dependent hydrolase